MAILRRKSVADAGNRSKCVGLLSWIEWSKERLLYLGASCKFKLMKSTTETKFDRIVKQGFHEILKPLGFKKKGNNFYSYKNGIGHIINLQKSYYYSKDHIHFTINTGIFLPEFWSSFYNYFNKPIPDFPTEPECVLRKRIGQLRNENDLWYDITEDGDENGLITEMKKNLNQYILPHFG